MTTDGAMTTDGLRFGIVLLPQDRWPVARERWQRAEMYGFDHAWTYDHLVARVAQRQRGPAVDRDPVRQGARGPELAALGQRHALVQPEQLRVVRRRVVLDQHHDVVHQPGQRLRHLVQRVGHQLLEPAPGHLDQSGSKADGAGPGHPGPAPAVRTGGQRLNAPTGR